MLQKSTVMFVYLFLLVPSPRLWSQPTTSDFSTWSDAEKEAFLLRAEVVKGKRVSTGVTGTLRATLSEGQYTHDASEFRPGSCANCFAILILAGRIWPSPIDREFRNRIRSWF